MSGKSGRRLENSPDNCHATEGQDIVANFRSNTPRSITPKGTLFPNLGEAHQAITSRLASRSGGHPVPDTLPRSEASPSSTLDALESPSSDRSPRNVAPSESTNPILPAHLTPLSNSTSAGSGWGKTPTDPSPVISSLGSDSSTINSATVSQQPGAKALPGHSEPTGSRSTVEDIYERYMPSPAPDLGSQAVDSQVTTVAGATAKNVCPEPSSVSMDTSLAGPELADGHLDRIKKQALGLSSSNEPPPTPLPEPPHPHNSPKESVERPIINKPLNYSHTNRPLDSRSNARHSLAVSTGQSQLSILDAVPAPLFATSFSSRARCATHRVERFRDGCGQQVPWSALDSPGDPGYQESDISHGAVSNTAFSTGECTTDSDEDPFKYDRGSFTVFLQPSREREVSAALRCVSGESTASVNGLLRPSSPEEPATPRAVSSTNPFVNKLQFYQASTVNYNWDDDGDPQEVKISLRSPPALPASPTQPAVGLSEQAVQRLGSQRRRKDIHTLMSDGADWETVATSVGQFGQFDSNRALASSTGLSGSYPVKITGSSIADYSDTSSFQAPRFDGFSSTDRILPHSTADNAPSICCQQTLKGTRLPVFLPKPRIHRVNGYLQDSHRLFADPSTESSRASARSALVDKLSYSIRSRSARKREQRRDRLLHMDPWSKSGFVSLDSLSSTGFEKAECMRGVEVGVGPNEQSPAERASSGVNGEPVANGRVKQQCHGHNEQPTTSVAPNSLSLRKRLNSLDSPNSADRPDSRHQSHQSHQSHGPESPTLFSFPLISLQEAARREAIRVRTGDDLTNSSGVRTRKNSSMDSSQATQRTTPPSPHIATPAPTHARRPTATSGLRVSTGHHGSSIYSQEGIVIGHERGISNVTSYKSKTPLVTGRRSALSRSFRNPFEPGDSSLRTSHAFPRPPSVLDSPRLVARDKRHGIQATSMTPDLRHIASLETEPPFRGFPMEDSYLSWEARRRRQAYYYAMCLLCIFPFMAPLIYRGTFDSALSWYTRGEVGSLTQRQRRNVLFLGTVILVIWLCVLAVFVTVIIVRHQQA